MGKWHVLSEGSTRVRAQVGKKQEGMRQPVRAQTVCWGEQDHSEEVW